MGMGPRETGWEVVDWIRHTQGRNQWRTVVNTVMNCRFAEKPGNLTGLVTVSFSRRLHSI